MTALEFLWLAAALCLAAGAVAVTLRAVLGPSSLDRLIALDTLAAVLQCGLALYVAWTLDTTVIPAILALALLGFLGTVGATRFRVRDATRPPAGAASTPAPAPKSDDGQVCR